MEFGFDSLWMMAATRLIRVDPATNTFVEIKLKHVSGTFRAPAVGEGAVWIPGVANRAIVKIDPTTNTEVLRFAADMYDPEAGIAAGLGSVWVVTQPKGQPKGRQPGETPQQQFNRANRFLTRFDAATGALQATIDLPSNSSSVICVGGSVWVTGTAGNEVYRIDPNTDTLAQTIKTGIMPRFAAAGTDTVWCSTRATEQSRRSKQATGV